MLIDNFFVEYKVFCKSLKLKESDFKNLKSFFERKYN